MRTARWKRNPAVLWRGVSRGAVLLTEPEELTLLNGTASAMWLALEQPQSLVEVVQEVANAYQVDEDVVADAVEPVMVDLIAKHALVPADDAR